MDYADRAAVLKEPTIQFHADAIRDLEDQVFYLIRKGEWGAVERFERAVAEAAYRAATLPKAYPVSEVAALGGHGDWRKTRVGRWPHTMFYRPVAGGAIGIEVLRIISGRRDVLKVLKE